MARHRAICGPVKPDFYFPPAAAGTFHAPFQIGQWKIIPQIPRQNRRCDAFAMAAVGAGQPKHKPIPHGVSQNRLLGP